MGTWTLLAGSDNPNGLGSYGTKEVPSTSNLPRARANSVACTYKCELLVFGGSAGDGSSYLNDLWLYHVYTGEWEWVSGSNGSLGGNAGLNATGVYGTKGTPAAANVPGARRDATGWVVGDKFYVFGGIGYATAAGTAGDLNDLWCFDLITKQWTWLSGSNALNDAGVYPANTSADESDAIYPAARSASTGWATVDKRIWMTGGFITSKAPLNDIWLYNTTNNKWTWRSGSKVSGSSGRFGNKGVAEDLNHPAARWTGNTFVGVDGSQWFFGGGGKDGMGGNGRCSDMWRLHILPPAGSSDPDAPQADLTGLTILNYNPTSNNVSTSTQSTTPISGTLTGSDLDGDPLQFLLAGGNTVTTQGTFNLQSGGKWTYTPNPYYSGNASFSFTANDAYGGSSPVYSLRVTVATNLADGDGDGIPDAYEALKWGSALQGNAAGDSDGDGQNNLMEYLAGTDPMDGSSFMMQQLSISPSAGGQSQFSFQLDPVRSGIRYHLETTTDLLQWQRLGTFEFATPGKAVIDTLDPVSEQLRLYRIRLESTLAPAPAPAP